MIISQGSKNRSPRRHLATCSAALATRKKSRSPSLSRNLPLGESSNCLTNSNVETVAVFYFRTFFISGRVVVLKKICTDRFCKLPLDLCFVNLKLKKFSRGLSPLDPHNFSLLRRPPKFRFFEPCQCISIFNLSPLVFVAFHSCPLVKPLSETRDFLFFCC